MEEEGWGEGVGWGAEVPVKWGASSLSLESYCLIIAESTHKGVNWRWKCVTQVKYHNKDLSRLW